MPLTRRAELRLHQRIAGLCPGPQGSLHPVTRQTVALRVGAARSGRGPPASGSAGYTPSGFRQEGFPPRRALGPDVS